MFVCGPDLFAVKGLVCAGDPFVWKGSNYCYAYAPWSVMSCTVTQGLRFGFSFVLVNFWEYWPMCCLFWGRKEDHVTCAGWCQLSMGRLLAKSSTNGKHSRQQRIFEKSITKFVLRSRAYANTVALTMIVYPYGLGQLWGLMKAYWYMSHCEYGIFSGLQIASRYLKSPIHKVFCAS